MITLQNGFATMDADHDGLLSSNEMKLRFALTKARYCLTSRPVALRVTYILLRSMLKEARMTGLVAFMHADKDMNLDVDEEEWAHWCQREYEHIERMKNTWDLMDKNKYAST